MKLLGNVQTEQQLITPTPLPLFHISAHTDFVQIAPKFISTNICL